MEANDISYYAVQFLNALSRYVDDEGLTLLAAINPYFAGPPHCVEWKELRDDSSRAELKIFLTK